MLQVRLFSDPIALDAYTEHEVPAGGLVDFLRSQFEVWPETARVYRGEVSVENDVTPTDEHGAAALKDASEGLYQVVVYPGDPVTAIITALATLALTAVVLLFLMPKIPNANTNIESANNSLGSRTNKPRPNERVEDIFGRVVSFPTTLTVPIITFEEDVEVEVWFGCVGRGSYDIERVRDGGTPLTLIAGAGAEFYAPGTSPNSGAPQLTVGAAVDAPFRSVVRLNEVNGQELDPPNSNNVSGNDNIRFVAPNYIENDGSIDFTDYFGSGDDITVTSSGIVGGGGTLYTNADVKFDDALLATFDTVDPSTAFDVGMLVTLSNAVFSDGTTTVDLGGVYEVLSFPSANSMQFGVVVGQPSSGDWSNVASFAGGETYIKSCTFSFSSATTTTDYDGEYPASDVSPTVITLADPELVNPAWSDLVGSTAYLSPSLYTNGEGWVGWFVVDMDDVDTLVLNIYAPQGMYKVTKKGKDVAWSASAVVEVAPVDDSGDPTGPATSHYVTIYGDGSDKSPKGKTLEISVTAGRYRLRARRTSPKDLDSEDTIVDELKWRDCYGTSLITETDFGNVTTVFTKTYATSQATGQKERKLSCLATRRVLERNIDDTFGPALVASTNAADIICHMALDPFIGGRELSELDVPQIYDTVAEVQDYFGFPEAASFNYTFDEGNVSFEEMVQTVAQAVFCTAYRQGSLLRLFFERATEDSTLLFNHRNKLPGSETRTIRFGRLNDNDGVELTWVDPDDGSKLTLYRPADRSAVKPKKIEVLGVQDERHANLHIDRAWNKIQYQHTTTQFDGLAEATQLVRGERIEVADNTRPDVFDGEVTAQTGLTLTLSQPVVGVDGVDYTIFLQRPDGGLDVIDLAPIVGEVRTVTLLSAPTFTLSLDPDAAVATLYQITGSTDAASTGFILTEKGTYDKRSLQVQAINYDPRYYQSDDAYL